MNKQITLWYRFNKSINDYEFNHIEDGLSSSFYPIPLFPSQNSWKNQKWIKSYATLQNHIIIGEQHV